MLNYGNKLINPYFYSINNPVFHYDSSGKLVWEVVVSLGIVITIATTTYVIYETNECAQNCTRDLEKRCIGECPFKKDFTQGAVNSEREVAILQCISSITAKCQQLCGTLGAAFGGEPYTSVGLYPVITGEK